MASISEPFIRRPVGTTLLAIGLFLVGGVAYEFLPVAAVPNVDFPMIRVFATRPGADPSVMAATVAAPLERKLGEIAGLEQIGPPATCRPRSTPRSPICRATCRACPASAKPIPRRRRYSCWR
jgi:Cu/Ag efflux pump CusA